MMMKKEQNVPTLYRLARHDYYTQSMSDVSSRLNDLFVERWMSFDLRASLPEMMIIDISSL